MKLLIILSLCLWVGAASPAFAEHEGEAWVLGRVLASWSEQIQRWNRLSSPDAQDLLAFDALAAELKARRERIRQVRFDGLAYSDDLLRAIEGKFLPAIKTLAQRWNHPLAWNLQKPDSEARILESELRARLTEFPEARPALGRMLALAAFSRSGTVGAGQIGSWNPTSSERLQTAAAESLDRSLALIESESRRVAPLDLDFFARLQAGLLGPAEHFYSRPGQYLSLNFERGDGESVPLRDYLNQWIDRFNQARPSAGAAIQNYSEFLHLHPFGDSNGRIAEVAKQIVLGRAGLPALLTPEKTSTETYLSAVSWGETDFTTHAVRELRETSRFLDPWLKLLREGWKINFSTLSGSNLVVALSREGAAAVAITLRVLQVPEQSPLPPAKGAVVVASAPADDVRLRLGIGDWSNPVDLSPVSVVQISRLDAIQAAYPVFLAETGTSPEGSAEKEILFAFHYAHESGHEVWFNNDGRDFRARIPSCVQALKKLGS